MPAIGEPSVIEQIAASIKAVEISLSEILDMLRRAEASHVEEVWEIAARRIQEADSVESIGG